MTGSKHNREGNSGERSEPGPRTLLEADASRLALLGWCVLYGRSARNLRSEWRPGMASTWSQVSLSYTQTAAYSHREGLC
jgi:hypothetical protein